MRKKAWLVWLWMLLSLLIGSGCTPYMTYDEMDEAIAVTTDPDEKEKLEERMRRFERDVERADEFFWLEANCPRYENRVWVCVGAHDTQAPRGGREFDSLDDKVRTYRRLRNSCGCSSREDLFF